MRKKATSARARTRNTAATAMPAAAPGVRPEDVGRGRMEEESEVLVGVGVAVEV